MFSMYETAQYEIPVVDHSTEFDIAGRINPLFGSSFKGSVS
jgi:hypothetical protein